MDKEPPRGPPPAQPGADPSGGFDLSQATETPDNRMVGNLSVPSYSMEVHVKSPPRIVWYWVLKQNVDRLKDALSDERGDRRPEFIFGFSGLALGSLEATISGVVALVAGDTPTIFQYVLSLAFLVSVLGVVYFWKFVTPAKSKVDDILKEIEEHEGQANVTRSTPKS